MPFKSEAQKRFMWAKHPEIARRWTKEGKGHVAGKKMPMGGGTTANNKPVGSAGQPEKMAAIGRRLKNMGKKGKADMAKKKMNGGGY
jgi:hypothetical protein